MKVRTLLLFIFMFLNFNSCMEAPLQEAGEGPLDRSSEALKCSDFRDSSCDMNWYILSSADSFPRNLELLINDKVIFNECLRDINVAVTRTNFQVEVIIYKFANLKAGVPFSLTINDLGDCYSQKVQFYNRSVQPYELREVNSTSNLIIRI